MRQAYDALAPGGTCVVIGIPPSGSTLELDAHRTAVRVEFPRMVDLYLASIRFS